MRQGTEALEPVVVVRHTWEEVKTLEEKNEDYPHRSLIRLLVAEALPPRIEPGVIGKMRGVKPERWALINGEKRRVAVVNPIYTGEYGVIKEDDIVSSELLPDVVISKGYGPCVFMAGFKDGKGFLTHNLPLGFSSDSVRVVLSRLGIPPADEDVQLFVGGGLKAGRFGQGGSGRARHATMKGIQEHGLEATDLDGRSDASEYGWKSTSVAVDGKKGVIVVITN